jgi:hypothetical protein
VESDIHTPDANIACHRRRRGTRPEQTVSTGPPLWERDNTSVLRKSLSNAETSCEGLRRPSAGTDSTDHGAQLAWLITYTQCALPVFEGLLRTDRENDLLRTLLFDLATWHAYAKLRLHTDTTINDFRTVTSTLGRSVRVFIREVCSKYDTTELPHEMAARGRRVVALVKKSDTPTTSQRRLTSTRKILNLSTYKYHALGDYPDTISRFGTTDNASTQTASVIPRTCLMLLYLWSLFRGSYSTRSSNVDLHAQTNESSHLNLQRLKYAKGLCDASNNASQTAQACHNSGGV